MENSLKLADPIVKILNKKLFCGKYFKTGRSNCQNIEQKAFCGKYLKTGRSNCQNIEQKAFCEKYFQTGRSKCQNIAQKAFFVENILKLADPIVKILHNKLSDENIVIRKKNQRQFQFKI